MKGRALLLVLLLAVTVVAVACGEEGDVAEPATTPAATPAATTPATTAPGDGAADGAQVFATQCAGCHKADGSGGVGPDLRGEDDRAEIEERVRNGGGGMPAFGESLSDAEISAVAAHVTGL